MYYDIYLYTLCYYICCLLGACMRCTRLCPLKPGVTLTRVPTNIMICGEDPLSLWTCSAGKVVARSPQSTTSTVGPISLSE
jgi:hypothetical protein